jgi:hypothetical protein
MQVFEIAPASARALWFLLPFVLILVAVLVVILGGSALAMRGARFDLTGEGLRLHGDLYGRTIPFSELRGGAARRVDIGAGDYQPKWRTLGTALPGYRAGWFRLRNGEKALLYVTDPSKAVYIPTQAGYAVLLTPNDPDGFLNALRASAPGS